MDNDDKLIGKFILTTRAFCDYKNHLPNRRIDDIWYEGEELQITRLFNAEYIVVTYTGEPSFNTLCPLEFIPEMINRYDNTKS